MHHNYPEHLYDETRRAVAISYVRHEMRKLFPSLKAEKDFVALDEDIANWFAHNPTLAPVRDFWNGIYGISMGFRLKHIGEWVTSQNITWEQKTISVEKIRFGADFAELAVVGNKPTIEEVREWYFNPKNKKALDEARSAHEQRSTQTANRDTFPVIIRKLFNDDMVVMDGNRRLLRAVLFEQESVEAFIGTQVANPPLLNYWVPTSLLLDLVTHHRYWKKMGKDMTDTVAKTIAEIVRDSEVGRFELNDRCLNTKTNEEDVLLFEAIQKY